MGCRLPLLLLASFALLACSSTRNQGGGAVNVEFVHPEKYTDIALRDIPPERAREQLLPDLRRYLEKQAKLYVPADEVLDLRITDIDEAAGFGLWVLSRKELCGRTSPHVWIWNTPSRTARGTRFPADARR